jgi:murein DD-endopeptidase
MKPRPRLSPLWFAYLGWGLLLQGCATPPYSPPPVPPKAVVLPATPRATDMGSEIAMRAIALLGAPYRWGGNGPTAFDCSGLVRFIHDQVGVEVPRTAAEQYSAARPISMTALTPGDLLFFRIKGKRAQVSHVAIYAGEGRFVHAPQTGRPVELRTLDDEFYRPRLAGAGRLF